MNEGQTPNTVDPAQSGETVDVDEAAVAVEPVVLYRGGGLEIVRWPLMEKVQLVLDTHCLYASRGTLLSMIRGGVREVALPLHQIVTVNLSDRAPEVTITTSDGTSITLYGDGGTKLAALLWALGVPHPAYQPQNAHLLITNVELQKTTGDRPGTLAIGPAGVAYAPEGWLAQIARGGSLQFPTSGLRGARVEGGGTLVLSTTTASTGFQSAEARELLQTMRVVLASSPPCPPDQLEEDGAATPEYVAERLAALPELDPPLPELGDLLLATPALWTADQDHVAWALVILGTEHLLILPDDPELAPWWLATGRVRRGDLPDDLFQGGDVLRIADRQRVTAFRLPGGAPIIQRFWEEAAPFHFVVPEEDFQPDQWRGITGPAAFFRLTPDGLTEQILRPAFTIQRKDGLGLVLREGDPWTWKQGEFLRAEVSRPRGVFRFTLQFLRMDPDASIGGAAASALGAARSDVLRLAVLMPGPNPPGLLPPKRTLLRLPTDEATRLVMSDHDGEADLETTEGRSIKGRLVDLSAGGCAVQIAETMQAGIKLAVIPEGGRARHVFKAEVMEVRTVPEASRLRPGLQYEVGLRFMGLNEARLSWLQREVLRRQRKRVAIRANAEDQDPDALPLLDRHYHP